MAENGTRPMNLRSYGLFTSKDGRTYLAVDYGGTFVHTLVESINFGGAQQLMVAAANNGVRLEHEGWRARLARRLVGMEK